MALRSLSPQVRARGVTAVLGPTNTGKTHLAIERMLGHGSGMIGLPLRLLAREVYGRVVERVGPDKVALVTGEEKIKPPHPRFWIATVEAMPRDLDLDFCAIDEIQLAADMDRGHVFTDRLLNQRGRYETLIIGAATMRPLVESLIPGVNVVSRPRLSRLTFAGEKKITRLPRRSCIVAFSADEVYGVAELIRRQKGGAAVVLGALSPRTRNAQVELYQNGDVDYLVATDAVGMGLNLDVDHIAFAADRKFDGHKFRHLYPAELGQVAGRAGRYLRDGTFGTTGRCPPFDPELALAIEDHAFDAVRMLQWRNPDLSFQSLATLQQSLAVTPREPGLTLAPAADDELSLEAAARDPQVRDMARGLTAVRRLWEVAQVPDYRKVAPAAHAELVITLFHHLMKKGRLPQDWFSAQIAQVDRVDGDIDTLSARIAQIRTWTFVANRPDWLADPEHWQGITRQVEDKLSDALHERLAQRFVDRRTSVLMRRLRENAMLEAQINATGDVLVAEQHVGTLIGFQFAPDARAEGSEEKALRLAAAKALAGEIDSRAERLSQAPDEAVVLANDGVLRWNGEPVGKLAAGERTLAPRVRVLADEHLTGAAREKVEKRLEAWIEARIIKLLGPIVALENPPDLSGTARGIAFQIAESLGVLDRAKVAEDVKGLDQPGRAALRAHGIRFGAYHLYLPALLKPAPRALACLLHALKAGDLSMKGLDELPHLAASGRTSIAVDPTFDKGLYRTAGFRVCASRAIRVDILERLADLIRPAIQYRPGQTPGEPPAGAADNDGFVVTVAMTSLAGCSGEDFAAILRSLGYALDRRPGPAITKTLVPLAPTAPVAATPPAKTETAIEDEADAEPQEAAPGSDGQPEMADDLMSAPTEHAEPVLDEAAGADLPAMSASTEAAMDSSIAAPQPETPAAGTAEADEAPEAGTAEVAPADVEIPADPAGDEPRAAADSAPDADQAAESAGEADVATPDVAAPAAEPDMIDVWRPQRHRSAHAQPRRDHRRSSGGQRPDHAGAGAGTGEAQRGPRRAQGGNRPAPRDGETGEKPARPRHGRPERADRQDRPDRPDRRSASHERGPRPERFQQPERQARPERQPDPNSPFAKLLALKAQLEGKDKS